ncbi:MAG: helix-turn-helix domain-containing protein [Candidatus Dormibacteraceae bacterium]
MVRHQGKEVALTNREFQLLQFLLDHPHRYSTTSQILGQAWADPPCFPRGTQLRSAGPEDTRGSRDPGGPRQQAQPRLLGSWHPSG